MFENILHSPLRLHGGATQAAHSLLQGLLERCVCKRLGGSRDLVRAQASGDAYQTQQIPAGLISVCVQAELQEHSFFAPIDWDDLLARKLRPPFVPNLVGKDSEPIG